MNPESATVDAGSATVDVAVATDHGQEAPVDPDRAAFEDAAAGDTRAFEVLVLLDSLYFIKPVTTHVEEFSTGQRPVARVGGAGRPWRLQRFERRKRGF